MRRASEGPRVPIRRQAGARRRPDGEARFRALVRHATDVIAALDAAGAIRYISPAVESVPGYRPEERLAGSAFDLIHPDDTPGAGGAAAHARHGGGIALRLRHRDSSWRHAGVAAKNLLGDPAVGGIVVNYRDATARRAAEEGRDGGPVEATAQLLRSAAEVSPRRRRRLAR